MKGKNLHANASTGSFALTSDSGFVSKAFKGSSILG